MHDYIRGDTNCEVTIDLGLIFTHNAIFKNMLFVVSVKGEIKAARKLFYTMYEVQAYKTH
jgi:hypothetical protein